MQSDLRQLKSFSNLQERVRKVLEKENILKKRKGQIWVEWEYSVEWFICCEFTELQKKVPVYTQA